MQRKQNLQQFTHQKDKKMTPNFEEILLELSYRIPTGIVDLTNKEHLDELVSILEERRIYNSQAINTLREKVKKNPKAKTQSDLDKTLSMRFTNPDTGREVSVATALGYEKDFPKAFNIAKGKFKAAGFSDKDIDMVDVGPDDAETTPNAFGVKGGGANVFEPEADTTSNLNLKPDDVAKRTAALAQVINKDFSPELKKSLGEKGIKTLLSGFEKMISGQKVSAQEKELLQNFVAFKDKSGEATLYIANKTPGNFKTHKKVTFPATKREQLKQLSQSFGLQSTKAQEGAMGKKQTVANKVTPARKVVLIKEETDGSVIIDGVKHKPVPVPKLKELALLLKKNGVPDAEVEAKSTIASLKRYNKQLEMMKKAGKFEIVDFGDTSTPEGRQSTFDNVKNLYIKRFEQLLKESGPITKEQKIVMDKFKSIQFNQNGSNPNFEKELDDLLSSMTLNKDFRTAVPDLLEVIVFSKMIGRGYQAFLPSSETFKVSDVIAFKEPNFKFPKSGNIAQAVADNFKMIKTSLVLVGGSSVKFAEGGAGQSDSKVEQTEYKHPETKVVLESLLSTHQFVYGRSKDSKYPPSTQDIVKKEKQIMFHLNWALKNNVITKDEYNRIMAQADKQSESAFQTAMRNGVGPLNDKEKIEYKKLLRLHALSGASIETINNNDTDFNYFSNERSTVNERTGAVKNEELDGIVNKCCMSWSYNPGFKFSKFEGKVWMTPNNVNPSHIVSCDKKKR
jgi:hypothetical protein